MKRRWLFFVLYAACTSPRTSSRTAPTSDDALPAGLRSGPHEVALNGARHFYRVGGVAEPAVPPVVFLHGGPGQGSAHFDALAGPYMERALRMVYFDQRGSGHSERPASNDYALATLVDDIEALRRTLGVPKVALLGHSFGGLLALEYATTYPGNVSHLVFVAGLWDTQLQCRLRAERLAALRPEAYARVHSVNAARDVRNTGELGRALFSAGLLQYRFTGHDRLTMPVLVVAGRHDGAAGPVGLRELARRLPNARYLEFERSGHFVYLDEPDRFAREVAAFVRGR